MHPSAASSCGMRQTLDVGGYEAQVVGQWGNGYIVAMPADQAQQPMMNSGWIPVEMQAPMQMQPSMHDGSYMDPSIDHHAAVSSAPPHNVVHHGPSQMTALGSSYGYQAMDNSQPQPGMPPVRRMSGDWARGSSMLPVPPPPPEDQCNLPHGA